MAKPFCSVISCWWRGFGGPVAANGVGGAGRAGVRSQCEPGAAVVRWRGGEAAMDSASTRALAEVYHEFEVESCLESSRISLKPCENQRSTEWFIRP